MLDWLKLIRASGLFTIVSNLTAAIFVATYQGGNLDLKVLAGLLVQGQGLTLLWMLVASSCLFISGMLWNDLADVERDRVLHPKRPLPAQRIGLAPAYIVGSLVVVLSLVAAAMAGGGLAFQAAGLVLSLALLYDFAAKHVPWLGSIVMASVRSSHAMFGLFLVGADAYLRAAAAGLNVVGVDTGVSVGLVPLLYPLLLGSYILGVTLISELESRVGRRWELSVGGILMVLPILVGVGRVASAPWISQWQQNGAYVQLVASVFLGLGITALWVWKTGIPVFNAVRIGRRGLIGPAVGAGLGGMVLLDALITTSAHPVGGLFLLVLYPIFRTVGKIVRMD